MVTQRRGQSTAEYAILIGVVIGALVAMQTYVKRGAQGRIKAVVDSYTAGSVGSGQIAVTNTRTQYEPYYLESNFNVGRSSETTEQINLPANTITRTSAKPETTVRGENGQQVQRPWEKEAD